MVKSLIETIKSQIALFNKVQLLITLLKIILIISITIIGAIIAPYGLKGIIYGIVTLGIALLIAYFPERRRI